MSCAKKAPKSEARGSVSSKRRDTVLCSSFVRALPRQRGSLEKGSQWRENLYSFALTSLSFSPTYFTRIEKFSLEVLVVENATMDAGRVIRVIFFAVYRKGIFYLSSNARQSLQNALQPKNRSE